MNKMNLFEKIENGEIKLEGSKKRFFVNQGGQKVTLSTMKYVIE